ncbi:hypothetical protein [Succinimonas amylolytica]|uniref:hypothetical protein n=1 Tax=Succinimonas amylolytica TaxID=83769 RepID=UPI0023A79B44
MNREQKSQRKPDRRFVLIFMAFMLVLGFGVLIADRCDTARLVPGKGLEETLANMGNRALYKSGRSDKIERVENIVCEKTGGRYRRESYSCTARAYLAGGRITEMCITKDFEFDAVPKGRGTYKNRLTLSVSMCRLGRAIDAVSTFEYADYDYDLTSDTVK